MVDNNEQSDEEKFMEVAVPQGEEDGTNSPRESKTAKADPDDDIIPDNEDDINKKYARGALTQWTRMGPGFAAIGPTVKKITPGVYKVLVLPNGTYVMAPKKIVTDNLLRLPDSKSDMVVSEVEKFWTLKKVYSSFGFLHKRGFLLWGPPGSGKTSTTAIVIQQMVKQGGVVVLMEVHPTHLSAALAEFRQVEADRPIVIVMEDVDAIIEQYGEPEVLSLLDGESSIDNVVFLATTNYPEQLDGRIVNRPSRFDRIVLIDMPNAEARKLYLEDRGLDKAEVKEWVKLTEGFSIAHMKEMIVGVKCLGQPVDSVANRLRRMFNKVKSGGKDIGFGDRKTDEEST